jgi:tetratricopeptide (TPR) repeat protein
LPIRALQDSINNSTDTALIFKLYGVLVDTLEKRLKTDLRYRTDLASYYGKRSWYGLFLKKYKESEQAGLRGLALDSRKSFIKTNLGHALLFQGKYEAALKVYADYIDDAPQYGDKTNIDVLLEDFMVLEQAGIMYKDIEKVKVVLREKEKK